MTLPLRNANKDAVCEWLGKGHDQANSFRKFDRPG